MKISTGNEDFDEWLNGGYESDIITTIYGPAGSGKTNFCVLAAAALAVKGKKVIFIDTEGGFSVERLAQIADASVLKNILMLKATSFKEQKDIFNNLLGKINKDIGLIVVDSAVMLYRLEMSMAKSSNNDEQARLVNRALAKQLEILNEIARNKNIPVIITNQVYSPFIKKEELGDRDIEEEKAKQVRMVGGDILKYWSKCIIELRKDGSKRKAILRKHRSLPEKEFSFSITGKGIEKSGFRLF